jgi:putative surface cell wall-binding protein
VSLVIASLFGVPDVAAAATASNSTQFAVNAGSLLFNTAPSAPNFPTVTLNGSSQTDNVTMNTFSVTDATGSGSGWNVTVNGDASGGKSAVFKQYCPNATCGTDTGPGYVAGGASLPASSLTLNSTGGVLSGLLGTIGIAPTFGPSCSSGCALDVSSSSPTKVLTAALGAGMGIWQAGSFSATSLAVAVPASIQLLQTNEVYRLDLLWTLGSGP